MPSTRSAFSTGRKSRNGFFYLALVSILLVPMPLFGVAQILDVHEALPDLDSRVGSVAPDAFQQSLADSLGASVRWNAFGTPQSLIRYGDYLGTGYAADPATAARDWLRDYAPLFALSGAGVDGLELVNVSQLAGADAHAVLFRQRFGGLAAADGGLIIVGVADGKIAYASSSAAGEQAAPAAATLTPTAAWLIAGASVGYNLGALDLLNVRQEDGWTLFDVDGMSHPQRVRPVAYPTFTQGVLPAFETIVLDVQGGHAAAYTVFVDGQTGDVLARHNRVQQLAKIDQQAPGRRTAPTKASDTQAFTGSYQDAPDAAACGPQHGPYAVPANAVRIVVVASAAIVSNDIFINLYHESDLASPVASGDLGTSPETLVYEPAGGPDAGNYFAQVCPFTPPPAPPTPPYNYAGTFTWEDTEQPDTFQVPKWNLFYANPPLDLSSLDTRTLACWTLVDFDGQPVPGCEAELQNLAARAPWDHDFQTNSATLTTLGNAASSAEAWGSPLTPAEGYRPTAADRNYDFTWQNTWLTSQCSPTVFTAPGATQANDIDAATANLFGMHNQLHDWSYFLGFTERNYNLQVKNFGLTPANRENDPEVGNVQAGAVSGGAPSYLGRDNANQITLNDGIPGITNMYLWQPIAAAFYPPCVDGDYDMGVIGHEYTHAISNRMAGGPDGNLSGAQAGAMGESWSDQVSMEYLNEYGLVPTGGESPYAVGTYVTGSGEKGIRNYNMSRNLNPPTVLAPTEALGTRNPLNYSNVGYDVTGVQVHADGEIWSATGWELRQALIDKYDAQYPASDAVLQKRCADGKEFIEHCPGNRRWIQIVFDAWLLMPGTVSMLDARDAYLAADVMRFGGANQAELWRVFANRGMGENAFSAGTADGDPIPSFESPLEGEATFRFNVIDADTGLPVEAEVFVGHYEARTTPVADTIAATSLGNTAAFIAGTTHDFLVRADGYGHVRFPRFVWSGFVGFTRTLTVRMAKNVASIHNGAVATGDGVNLDKLIDDTEATNWASLTAPAIGDTVTVDLAGDSHRITRVNVSALLRPEDANDVDSAAQNRFTALRQFAIRTCHEGVDPANLFCSGAIPAGFTTIYTSPADAFPGGVPRPLAPDLILREFDVPDTDATHVQLVVVHTQCTGGPAFQGEQDADPLNATDCDTVSANGGRVRAAELQVFTTASQPPPKDPAVVFTMSGPATASAGEQIDYQLDYTNLGPFDSSNASITDTLPAGVSFVAASGGGSYDAASHTVSWDLGTVAVGGPYDLTLTVAVDAGAAGSVLANQAEYSADLTVATPAATATAVVP